MAKITITIEDKPNGKVSMVCDPTFDTLMKKVMSGHEMTSADGYALKVIRTIYEESKNAEPTKIIIPKLVT